VTLLRGDTIEADGLAEDVVGGADQVEPGDVAPTPDSGDAVSPPEDMIDLFVPPQEIVEETNVVEETIVEEVGGCEDQCQLEEFYCVGIKEIHYCMADGDGCLVWDEGESCDDGNACTDDACAAEKGCVTADNKEECDDNDECTTGDACFEGSCAGSGSVTCDDDNLCTVDSCLPQSGCIFEPEPDGKACDASAQCAGGKCVPTGGPETLADNLDSPHDLVIDNSFVYFVEDDSDEGTVKKVSKTGGNVTTLAENLAEPLAITADSTHVYWLERNNGNNGRLAKVSKTGGDVVDLSTDLHNAQNHLAIAGGFLYFGDGKDGGGGVIKKVGTDGGTTIIVEGNGLLNLNTAIAVDNGLVYFRNDYDKVLRVSVDGGEVTELGSGEPSGLAIGDSWFYWTEYGNGTVMRMPINGGPGINVAKDTYGAGDLVVDGQYLYWIENNNPGKVRRASITGGDEKTYSNQANSLGIEVDEQYLYYAVSVYINKGKIIRTPK